ncbi:MAG: hypothetical protein RL724_1080, partial [Pseudomonadota bacterium]
ANYVPAMGWLASQGAWRVQRHNWRQKRQLHKNNAKITEVAWGHRLDAGLAAMGTWLA